MFYTKMPGFESWVYFQSQLPADKQQPYPEQEAVNDGSCVQIPSIHMEDPDLVAALGFSVTRPGGC